jgi:hypothetical protein
MERKQMTIQEIKQQTEFLQDALYQKGFDLGWEAALDSLDHISDALWNNGESATGSAVRDIIQRVRKGEHEPQD